MSKLNARKYLGSSLVLPTLIYLILLSLAGIGSTAGNEGLSNLALYLIFLIPIILSYFVANLFLRPANNKLNTYGKSIIATIFFPITTFVTTLICGFIFLAITGSYWGKENWYFDGYIFAIIISILIALAVNTIITSIVFFTLRKQLINNK